MWFKQAQLFQLSPTMNFNIDQLGDMLEPFSFVPCLPSFPTSMGWVSPLDEEGAPLVHAVNGNIILCLQVEDKILPATVVGQALKDKIKQIQSSEERRVRGKEKLSLKDEIVTTLLPRAFTRLTRIYAYIDAKNHMLVLNSTHAAKTDQFLSLFKKSFDESMTFVNVKKPTTTMTAWLQNKDYPTHFSVEKACVLQDPSQQNRVIRCQQQNLFAVSIQALLTEGCEVKQLALSWQDRVNFVLAEDFSLRSLQFLDDVISQAKDIDTETKQQEFDANFFIMTETMNALIADLLAIFGEEVSANEKPSTSKPIEEVVV